MWKRWLLESSVIILDEVRENTCCSKLLGFHVYLFEALVAAQNKIFSANHATAASDSVLCCHRRKTFIMAEDTIVAFFIIVRFVSAMIYSKVSDSLSNNLKLFFILFQKVRRNDIL